MAIQYMPTRTSEAAKKQIKTQTAKLKELQRQIDENKLARAAEVKKGPGFEALERTKEETKAGVTPPGYEGYRDIATGDLLSQYKVDPFTGEASQRIRSEALGTGPSTWAQNALGRQKFEEAQARGQVGLQQQQAQSQAQAQLMRQGGLGGGARTSLARSGARDALMAAQGVSAQGNLTRFGINDADATRRQELLGQTADVERQADLKNLGMLETDINRRAMFDANRYNQQMAAYGAKQTADATRAAGGGGGKK